MDTGSACGLAQRLPMFGLRPLLTSLIIACWSQSASIMDLVDVSSLPFRPPTLVFPPSVLIVLQTPITHPPLLLSYISTPTQMNSMFVLNLDFLILHRYHCSFHVFVRSHGPFRNDKTNKLYFVTCGLFYLWSERLSPLKAAFIYRVRQ